MRYLSLIFGVIFLFMVLNCCEQFKEENSEKDPLNQSIKVVKVPINYITDLEELALNYTPTSIDLSSDLNPLLEEFDLGKILDDEDGVILVRRVLNIFLLKQYIHHLKRANQGYNVHSMKSGKTTYIINKYTDLYQLDTIKGFSEFFNSGLPYILERRYQYFSNDSIIDSFMNEIAFETNRIENMLEEMSDMK